MKRFNQFMLEAKATPCGRCGTTHVAPKDGGKCPAVEETTTVDEAVNESFKKGDTVKIKNVKSYDVFAKNDTGTVIGMNAGKVQVKVGTGSMNVDPKDLVAEAKMTQAQQDAFAKKIGDEQRAKERSKKVSSMGAYKGRKVRKEEVVNEATTKFNSIGDFEKAAKEKGYTTTDDKKRGFVNAFKGTTSVGRYDFNKSQGFLKEAINEASKYSVLDTKKNEIVSRPNITKAAAQKLVDKDPDNRVMGSPEFIHDKRTAALKENYGVMSKQAFKRQEHEFEAELDRQAEMQRKANDAMARVIWIDGKVWKKDGKPVEFNDKKHAQNIIRTLKKKNPDKDFTAGSIAYYKQEGDTLKHKLKTKK